MSKRFLVPVTVPFVILTSCVPAGDPTADWHGTIDTLPSGTVVVTNPAEGLWAPGDGWRVIEELRIGALEGNGPDVFGNIKDFVVDGAGRMYIVDGQASEVRVFDRDGAFQYTVGGQGEGPGEFRGIWGVTLAPDGKLWVIDNSLGRWSIFTDVGEFDRSYRREIRAFDYVWAGGFDTAGNLWDWVPGRASTLHRLDVGMRGPPSDNEDTQPIVAIGENRKAWVDTRAAAFDTIGATNLVEYRAKFLQFRRGTARMNSQMPFAPRRPWVLDRRGYVWHAVTDEYRIYQTDAEGNTVLVVTRDLPPAPLGSAGQDSIFNLIANYRQDGWQPVDLDEVTFPQVRPLFENLTVDNMGGLWLWIEGDPNSTTYDVFDPQGRYLGEVTVPFAIQRFFNPHIHGDAFYTITQDELDVSYLVRGLIERK